MVHCPGCLRPWPRSVIVSIILLGLMAGAQSARGQRPSPPEGRDAHAADLNTSDPALGALPVGSFSDGRHYQISDFRGKVLVVLYFDPKFGESAAKLQDTLKWLATISDQPVCVLGMFAGKVEQVRAALHGDEPGFPMFQDNLGFYRAMYDSYGPCTCRVIGPDGRFPRSWGAGLVEVNKVLPGAAWKYKDGKYEKPLAPVVDLLAWNRYDEAIKKLKPLLKSNNKTVAESAARLFAAVLAEGETWRTNAQNAADGDPVKAYDLYARISTAFAGEELAAKVARPLKELRANAAVADELQARDMFNKVAAFLATAGSSDKARIGDALAAIVSKYGKTPTGKYVELLQLVWSRRMNW